ncbi:GNAT family N-acetyltransferase [Paenibacillus humicus]|uniref:GNAT family N-acetyltransferase n=1 Tax=Paenibacillus humicus TaxID=412861 RepID=UPI003F5CE1E2
MVMHSEVILRKIEDRDLFRIWELAYKDEAPEWKKWDAPYYEHNPVPYEEFLSDKDAFAQNRWVIETAGSVIGTAGFYWEHEPSLWSEMGIVIYEPQYWSGGYGTEAIRLLMREMFSSMPLVRVGYTTWSGNKRMIRVGEKLGMTMEARLRKCRYWNGEYYDSIRMGILREEWEAMEAAAAART